MIQENNIEIAALGYQHPGWDEQYYPEGLPLDWRLDYYNHHFHCVVMDAHEWVSAREGDIKQWLQDVSDPFNFFLSIKATDINDGVIKQVSVVKSGLGKHLQGVVIMQYDSPLSNEQMNALRALTVVHVDSEMTDQLPAEVKPCWRKDRQATTGSVIGFISREESQDIRIMRGYIETFMKVCASRQSFLVFEGNPPPSKTMQDAQVILELLTPPVT